MKNYLTIITLLLLSGSLFSQEATPNPLDFSKEQLLIEENGLPTLKTVDEMGVKANELYLQNNWEEAIAAYELYSKNTNWLANIISTSIEPYYGASYDDRKAVGFKTLNMLIPIEKKSNFYKKERNKAILRMGMCYYKLGNNEKAASYLLKALDLIDIDSTEEWNEAKSTLFSIIGYE